MYVQPISRPPSRRAASADSPPPPTLLSQSQSSSRETSTDEKSHTPLVTPPQPLSSSRSSSHRRKSPPGESSRRTRGSGSSRSKIKGEGVSSQSLPRKQSSRRSKPKETESSTALLQANADERRHSSGRSRDDTGLKTDAPPDNRLRRRSKHSTRKLPPGSQRIVSQASSREAPPSPGSDSTPKRHNSRRGGDDCRSLPADYVVRLDANVVSDANSRSDHVGSVPVSQPRLKASSRKSSPSSSPGVTPLVTPSNGSQTALVSDLDSLRRASLSGALQKGSPKSSLFLEKLPSYSRSKSSRRSSSSVRMQKQQDNMPALYRHALKQEWNKMMDACRLHPESASFVNPADGTTSLHLAVMSRTGYSPPVSSDDVPAQEQESEEHSGVQSHLASLEVIEELLQLCPEASKAVCKLYSYTPLAYACLVSGAEWNLEDSAAMVRLFLKHAPDCLSVFTEGGLSSLDVHIISFSYKNREQQVEDSILSGRTSTVVLRTLLEADPCLAHVRIRKDKVGGPVELLYRCNSGAFLDAVELGDKSYMKKKSPSEKNDKSVIATITNWWVWKWTILLLKYGTLTYKKKGAPFLAVQAAAAMVGCPLPVLTLALKAFPKQIRQQDEMQGVKGNLPLHEVASWPCQQDSESTEPVISSRKGMAISALLQEYPGASCIHNNMNQTPLELAVATGTTWDGGVRKLVRSNPDAVAQPSPISRLVPFLAAAAAFATLPSSPQAAPKRQVDRASSSRQSLSICHSAVAKKDVQAIRTIYGLLRADPTVLVKLTSESLEQNETDS